MVAAGGFGARLFECDARFVDGFHDMCGNMRIGSIGHTVAVH